MSNKISAKNINLFYGAKQALFDINLDFMEHGVTSLIGPSGCGKSSFLRCINRMNDTIQGCKIEGTIKIDNSDIYHKDLDLVLLRARVGMVFSEQTGNYGNETWQQKNGDHEMGMYQALIEARIPFEMVNAT